MYAGTVRLYTMFKHIFHVFKEKLYRNPLIGVVTCDIKPRVRDEFYLRMFFKYLRQRFNVVFFGRYFEQHPFKIKVQHCRFLLKII